MIADRKSQAAEPVCATARALPKVLLHEHLDGGLRPATLLELAGVRIAVASRKQLAADQAMFRHLRAEPADHAVLVLKSSVHFRADFGPIADRILVVEAPGPNTADPAKLPFGNLRPGMRTSPRRR